MCLLCDEQYWLTARTPKLLLTVLMPRFRTYEQAAASECLREFQERQNGTHIGWYGVFISIQNERALLRLHTVDQPTPSNVPLAATRTKRAHHPVPGSQCRHHLSVTRQNSSARPLPVCSQLATPSARLSPCIGIYATNQLLAKAALSLTSTSKNSPQRPTVTHKASTNVLQKALTYRLGIIYSYSVVLNPPHDTSINVCHDTLDSNKTTNAKSCWTPEFWNNPG